MYLHGMRSAVRAECDIVVERVERNVADPLYVVQVLVCVNQVA